MYAIYITTIITIICTTTYNTTTTHYSTNSHHIFRSDNDDNIGNGNEDINIEGHPYFDPNNDGQTTYNYTLCPIPDFPYNNSNFTRPLHSHIIHQNPYKYLYYYIETECS